MGTGNKRGYVNGGGEAVSRYFRNVSEGIIMRILTHLTLFCFLIYSVKKRHTLRTQSFSLVLVLLRHTLNYIPLRYISMHLRAGCSLLFICLLSCNPLVSPIYNED